MLIQLYCEPEYNIRNLVDFYYRNTSQNAILMFIFICIVFPISFLCVATIADNFLAVGMQDLAKRFNLSPTIAAVSLIAFANGAPDLLGVIAVGADNDAMFISLGALMGGFIFSGTLVISNVILNSKTGVINVPKYGVLKELTFYLLCVFIVSVFGLRGSTGYVFLIVYMLAYAFYIVMTFVAEKKDN